MPAMAAKKRQSTVKKPVPEKLLTGSVPGLGPGGFLIRFGYVLCVGHTRCLPKRPLAYLVNNSSWPSAAKASCCLSLKGRVPSELAEQAPKRTKRHSPRCDRPRGK